MDAKARNNVSVRGSGDAVMVFAHGYGCDQNMWRLLAPRFAERSRVVLYDLTGSGGSSLAAYDRTRHGSLHGHAQDLLEVVEACADRPVTFVGHSVSAMIGMLAAIAAPERFSELVMIGPSPCYIDDGDYVGGFSRADIESLLDTLDHNYLGWASAIAPKIMGAPDQPALADELTNSFCRTDPEIAKHFARVTFLSDNRADVPQCRTRTLVVQCSDDMIAPRSVGEYLHRTLPDATLAVVENIGHCPHLSAPCPVVDAMDAFLRLR